VHLSTSERQTIAGNLAQGISDDRILHDIRLSVHDDFHRVHLTSRKDINNIRQCYGIQGVNFKTDKSDTVSVAAWVAEMQELGVNNLGT